MIKKTIIILACVGLMAVVCWLFPCPGKISPNIPIGGDHITDKNMVISDGYILELQEKAFHGDLNSLVGLIEIHEQAQESLNRSSAIVAICQAATNNKDAEAYMIHRLLGCKKFLSGGVCHSFLSSMRINMPEYSIETKRIIFNSIESGYFDGTEISYPRFSTSSYVRPGVKEQHVGTSYVDWLLESLFCSQKNWVDIAHKLGHNFKTDRLNPEEIAELKEWLFSKAAEKESLEAHHVPTQQLMPAKGALPVTSGG